MLIYHFENIKFYWQSSNNIPITHLVALFCPNSVASFLISQAMTKRPAFCFSDSAFWLSVTMSFFCMTVLWRRRSNDHSSIHFFLCIAYFFYSLGSLYQGQKIIIYKSKKLCSYQLQITDIHASLLCLIVHNSLSAFYQNLLILKK